jgi:hypothetical protein
VTGFCFDTARDIATRVLSRWKTHRDFDDLIQETVLAAWKTSERRPDLDLAQMVTCAAKWQLSAWFRSKRCGDLISRYRNARIVVETCPWTKDGTAQIELSDFEPDFSLGVIDRLSPVEAKRDDEQLQWAAWLEKCDLLSYYREAARLVNPR